MKKTLSDSLKNSLNEERKSFKTKQLNTEDRFAKAEEIFNDGLEKRDEQNPVQSEAIKEKVIRDTFSLPENDYNLIESCKERSINVRHVANKSEIIRAGLITLSNLSDSKFLEAIMTVKRIKTGRPKQ